jgi:hypothetical protein
MAGLVPAIQKRKRSAEAAANLDGSVSMDGRDKPGHDEQKE